MSGYEGDIGRITASLDNLSVAFEKHLRTIDEEAHARRMDAVRDVEERRAALKAELYYLTAAANVAGVAPEAVRSVDTGRRPPSEVVLHLLVMASKPVTPSEIDAAVIAAGWSKAASEKAKLRLKNQGLLTADKRLYVITDKGRKEIGGQEPAL